MRTDSKSRVEQTIAAITTAAAIGGIAFNVVAASESYNKMLWGAIFVAGSLIGLAIFFGWAKFFDGTKSAYVKTYH